MIPMISSIDQLDKKHVKKAYLLKIGSAYIIPKDLKIDDNALFDKLIQCLNSSPLMVKVYKLSPAGKPTALNFWRLMEKGRIKDKLVRLDFSPYVVCKIHLPKKNQEIGAIWESSVTSENIDWSENFDVVYDGSIFLVSREIDLSKRAHPGSEDVREVFFATLNKEETWHMKSVAPVPLRENMILVFLVENEDTANIIGKTFFREPTGDLIFFLSENILKRVDQLEVDFLSQISSDLATFYDAVCKHEEVEMCRETLEETHIELKSVVDKLQKLHFYSFLAHHKALKHLENLISRHFSYILDYSLAIEALRKETEELRKRLKQNIWLKHLQIQLLEELEHKEINVDTLTRCADYVNGVAQRSYANKITLLAAILTIIGSILGSLIIDYVRSIL